ncbi:MAG: amidohydrolase family protein, partial [Bacteroidota bacterium]
MAGPEFFKEERVLRNPYTKGGIPGKMPYWKLITDSTDFVLAIAEAKGCGVTGIKFYTDVTNDLLIKAVKETKRQGLRVWSHAAIIPANALDAINAGVQVISHADGLVRECRGDMPFPEAWKMREKPDQSDEYWNEEIKKFQLNNLFARMNELNTIFDPTLSLFKGFAEMPGHRWQFEISKRVISQAYKAGVKICTGTDTDLRTMTVQNEMQYLVQYCNFSTIDVIISATKIGAEAIGMEKTCGTIELNKDADLVILDKNPLYDIKNIRTVNMVIKNGLIYKIN